MLTLGWSDGNSFLGIDFILLSLADKKTDITKSALILINELVDTHDARRPSPKVRHILSLWSKELWI